MIGPVLAQLINRWSLTLEHLKFRRFEHLCENLQTVTSVWFNTPPQVWTTSSHPASCRSVALELHQTTTDFWSKVTGKTPRVFIYLLSRSPCCRKSLRRSSIMPDLFLIARHPQPLKRRLVNLLASVIASSDARTEAYWTRTISSRSYSLGVALEDQQ